MLHIKFLKSQFYSRKLCFRWALIGASLVGLADDWLDIRQLGHKGRGIRFRFKIFLYAAVAAIGAWWFYFKLDFSLVHIPFVGNVDFGWWYIPFFILAVVSTSFAVNETDGLDGLAGGTLLLAFFAFGTIAFSQGKYDLVAFLSVVCGGLMAFCGLMSTPPDLLWVTPVPWVGVL